MYARVPQHTVVCRNITTRSVKNYLPRLFLPQPFPLLPHESLCHQSQSHDCSCACSPQVMAPAAVTVSVTTDGDGPPDRLLPPPVRHAAHSSCDHEPCQSCGCDVCDSVGLCGGDRMFLDVLSARGGCGASGAASHLSTASQNCCLTASSDSKALIKLGLSTNW